MTPNRRLDQLEPLMADSLQKIDRLIEGQGQILDVATRADQKADTTAKGLANLTVNFNEFKQEVRDGFKQIDQKIDTEVGGLRQEMNQKFDQVNQKIDSEVGGLRQEMNQRFDQLVTLIQERLK